MVACALINYHHTYFTKDKTGAPASILLVPRAVNCRLLDHYGVQIHNSYLGKQRQISLCRGNSINSLYTCQENDVDALSRDSYSPQSTYYKI